MMITPVADIVSLPLPRHVAVIGAVGGLGQGILRVCRAERVGFTAIVRSRPKRITDVPDGSRVTVRAGVNSKGKDERPVAAADWGGARNSWMPVSYDAMGRWMLEEVVANDFIREAPLVSRPHRPTA